MFQAFYCSAIGILKIVASDTRIHHIQFIDAGGENKPNHLTDRCMKQLDEYFNGARKEFDLPLGFEGTTFQKQVWQVLCKIPYGETRSYQEIAMMVGNPKACRAVGMANNHNPIVIVAPCHRVIGKQGTLVGYGGGLDKKRYLLELEKNMK